MFIELEMIIVFGSLCQRKAVQEDDFVKLIGIAMFSAVSVSHFVRLAMSVKETSGPIDQFVIPILKMVCGKYEMFTPRVNLTEWCVRGLEQGEPVLK